MAHAGRVLLPLVREADVKGHRLTLDLPMDEDEQPTGETGEGLCECGAGWNGGIDGIRASHYAHIDQED